MNAILCKLSLLVKKVKREEEGQNMISYVLLAALVACGATAGMSSTASGISSAYSGIANNLATAVQSPATPPAKNPKTPKTPKAPKSKKSKG